MQIRPAALVHRDAATLNRTATGCRWCGCGSHRTLLAIEGLILLREHPELRSTLYRRWHEGLVKRLHPGVFVGPAPVSESLRLLALCRWAPRAVLHGATGAALWLDEWSAAAVSTWPTR